MRGLPLPEDGDGVLTDGGETLALRELPARASLLARELQDAGVAPDAAIALECTNSVACALALIHGLDAGRTLVLLPGGEGSPPTPEACSHRLRFPPGRAAASPEIVPNAAHAPGCAASPRSLYLCTSGTTGEARFVVHAQARLLENARACARRFELAAGDRVALPVPIHHLFGLGAAFLPALLVDASVDLQHGANLPRFLARERAFDPEVAFMTPAFAETLVRGRRAARRYRLTVMAGDRLREETFDRYEERFGTVVQLYGSSELGAIAATRPGDPRALRRASLGRPLDGVTLRLAAEPSGELECRHAHGFDGYADASGQLGPRHDTGSWHPTRDLARFDADGGLVILGRLDHCVKRDGLLVALGEVEAALEGLAGVATAAVVAAGATVRGRGIVAFCCAEGDAPRGPELRRALAERLPRRALPDAIEVVDALPLLESGKLDRRALARRADEILRPAPPPLRAAPMTAGVRMLQVEPTTRCNFSCGFCCGRAMDQSDLAFDDYARALEQFPALERVELHGEGEPTLHPRLVEMARLARARGARVSSITNGSLLTPARVDGLLDAGIDALFVSIESAEPEAFQEIRGGKLARVRAGIRTLLAARDQRGLDRPTVGFSVTVLKRTRLALAGIVQLYRELGMDGGISLHMLNRMPAYTEHYVAGMEHELLSKEEQALAWLRYARAVRREGLSGAAQHFSDEVFGQLDAPADAGGARLAREYRSCVWLDRGLYLNRHGHTSGCARIKDTAAFGFGRIGDTAPDAIVAARDAMARRLRSGLVPAACQGCFVADSIETRMSKLLERRLRRPRPGQRALPGHASEAIGEVPRDPQAEAWLLAQCDGERTAREIIERVARRQDLEPEAARVRLLPLLGELVRRRELVIDTETHEPAPR